MVVVDDHQAVRELLSTILVRQSARTLEVVGEAGTGQEAIDVCVRLRPDLVILDMFLPGMNGVEVLGVLRKRLRGLRVIFFSGCVQEQLIAQAVAQGADGYVLKTQPLKSLLDAVDRVCDGGKYFDPSLSKSNNRLAIMPFGRRSPTGSGRWPSSSRRAIRPRKPRCGWASASRRSTSTART